MRHRFEPGKKTLVRPFRSVFLSGWFFLSVALLVPGCTPKFEYAPGPLPASFDEYYQRQLERSRQVGVRPGNEERLVRVAPRTDVAILYLHGFGASRAEGEAVLDTVTQELGANTYYTRLPGHGANAIDHASVTFEDYLVLAEESFAMTAKLGDRVVLVGTSTGALLATYLAARYPDSVAAVILVSPFYEFVNPTAFLFAVPGGLSLIHLLYGEDRDAGWKEDPELRKVDGYDNYWLTKQKYAALIPLDRLRRSIANEEMYRSVRAPVLLLHYYKDEQHQDDVASVPAMRAAFALFADGQPNPLSRLAPIADSNHIMLSKYVRTDKAAALAEIRAFLGAVLKIPANRPVAPAQKKAS